MSRGEGEWGNGGMGVSRGRLNQSHTYIRKYTRIYTFGSQSCIGPWDDQYTQIFTRYTEEYL